MKKQSNPPPPKCLSCVSRLNGKDGNGYQPCSCRPPAPPPPPQIAKGDAYSLHKISEIEKQNKDLTLQRNNLIEACRQRDIKITELEQQLAAERRNNNSLYLNIYHSESIDAVHLMPRHMQNAWDKGQKLWIERNPPPEVSE